VTLLQKGSEISAVKNVCSRKSGPKVTKIPVIDSYFVLDMGPDVPMERVICPRGWKIYAMPASLEICDSCVCSILGMINVCFWFVYLNILALQIFDFALPQSAIPALADARSRSQLLESHSKEVDRESRTGLIMATLWPLYFCPVVSFFLLLLYFFPSPNLSGRRLDVYHTSTHDVALVQI